MSGLKSYILRLIALAPISVSGRTTRMTEKGITALFVFSGLIMVYFAIDYGLVSRQSVSLAQNFILFCISGLISAVYFYIQSDSENASKRMALGIAYVALGVSAGMLIQIVWAISIASLGQAAIQFKTDYSDFISIGPSILIMIGYSCHASPIFHKLYGEDWAEKMAIFAMLVFMGMIGILSGIGFVSGSTP